MLTGTCRYRVRPASRSEFRARGAALESERLGAHKVFAIVSGTLKAAMPLETDPRLTIPGVARHLTFGAGLWIRPSHGGAIAEPSRRR